MFTYYWKLAVIMLLIIPMYFTLYMLYNCFIKAVATNSDRMSYNHTTK